VKVMRKGQGSKRYSANRRKGREVDLPGMGDPKEKWGIEEADFSQSTGLSPAERAVERHLFRDGECDGHNELGQASLICHVPGR
jgi:hypothetical protein